MKHIVWVFLLIMACSPKTTDNIEEQEPGKTVTTKLDKPPLREQWQTSFTGSHYKKEYKNLEELVLPKGFSISYFTDDIENPRAMRVSAQGTIFVGSRKAKKVYALKDTNGDGVADEQIIVYEGLTQPVGLDLKDGDLYVSSLHRIYKFDNVEENLGKEQKPKLVYDKFPKQKHHGWKFIGFGPDGRLYAPVGADCNNCLHKHEMFASIVSMNPDGSDVKIYAEGVRNSVGFDWHPTTGELWFTENGRDLLGNDVPPCELNYAPRAGLHFGYPYCHGGNLADPDFGDERNCSEFTPPAHRMGAHVAPLGMRFYTGDLFPKEYKHNIFITEHGSWNRSNKQGYRIMRAVLKDNEVVKYEPFIEGWLDTAVDDAWGRPADVLVLSDGSLLIADDYANAIYRVTYTGEEN